MSWNKLHRIAGTVAAQYKVQPSTEYNRSPFVTLAWPATKIKHASQLHLDNSWKHVVIVIKKS